MKSEFVVPAGATAVAHMSDLHIEDAADARWVCTMFAGLAALPLSVVLVSGDMFDHHSVSQSVARSVLTTLEGLPFSTVVLPGNHDYLVDGHYIDGFRPSDFSNVHILGTNRSDQAGTAGRASTGILLPKQGLEIVGKPHVGFDSFRPLVSVKNRPRRARWTIVMAHGHVVSGEHERYRAWPIEVEEIEDSGADYVALGHWDHIVRVPSRVPAKYSGSPRFTGKVTVVRFANGRDIEINEVAVPAGPGHAKN